MERRLTEKQALAKLGRFEPTVSAHLIRMFNLGLKQQLSISESFDQALRYTRTLKSKPFIRGKKYGRYISLE